MPMYVKPQLKIKKLIMKKKFDDPRVPNVQTIDTSKTLRNEMESRNFVELNPDIENRWLYSCYCGIKLDVRSDWYVSLYDGTILCVGCAKCGRCGHLAALDRKVVSIEGLIICYRCLTYYGYEMPPRKIKYVHNKPPAEVEKSSEASEEDYNNADSVATDNAHNSADDNEDTDGGKDAQLPRWRQENRRPLRRIPYPVQPKIPVSSLNPLLNPPLYTGTWSGLVIMLCPACEVKADCGPDCYIVPSMARVYHKQCFVCYFCKFDLSVGVRTAFKDFNYCSCMQPRVYCMSSDCQERRMKHHEKHNCVLGEHRPGGRIQCHIMGSDPLPTERAQKAPSKDQNDASAEESKDDD